MILVGVTETGPHTKRGHSIRWEIARPACGSETLSVVKDSDAVETMEPYPLSATFVDNSGNETPNVKAVKIGDLYVVGAKTDYFKMVGMDKTGKVIDAKYMEANTALTEATWKSAMTRNPADYKVK